MENRFGVKDLFLFLFLAALIVVVLLQMKQNDRQYIALQNVLQQGELQLEQLGSLKRELNDLQLAPPAAGPTTRKTGQDYFAHIRQAEELPGYTRGDWLIASGPNSDKLTPLVAGDAFAAEVQSRVLESLLTRDEVTLDWEPVLASSLPEVQDNSVAFHKYVDAQKAKGMTQEQIDKDPHRPWAAKMTFHLRHNLTFSDAHSLTAQDVVWTYYWTMNQQVDDPRDRAFLDKISSVNAVGDYEVVFTFGDLYFDSIGLAGEMSILPEHFYEKYSPDDFNKSTGLLLGSGPYRMESPTDWTPGSQVVLMRNEAYWGLPAPFDRVVYKIIDNDLARLTSFRNGDIDLFNAEPEQYNQLLLDKSLVARTQQFAYNTAISGYRYIAWNEQHNGKPTFFADRRVRQAMTMLIDRPRICRQIMYGYSTPITGPFNPLGKQNDPNIKPWPFDVDGAKALLKQAGFVEDGSGVLKGPDGTPFQFKLTYPSGISNYDQIALFLKDSFARAGITLIPDPLDWSVFADRLKKRDFDAISLGWTQGIEDDIYQMFDSSQIANDGDDFMSYKNPELDKLIEQARQTLDESKRLPLWHECARILHEDQPYTFLFTGKALEFIDGRFKNVHLVRLGLNSDLEWFVPKGQQKWEK